MRFNVGVGLICVALMCLVPMMAAVGEDLDATLTRMDRASEGFRAMTAGVHRVSHMAAINEDSKDSGSMALKRSKPKEMRMVINLTEPDPKSVLIQGKKAEVFYPKLATVQEFDLGKNKGLVDEFFLLGFGTSRKELESAYAIRSLGSENVNQQRTVHLELIPKSQDVLQHLKKLEMWVADNGYPLQQKFFLPGGDYNLVTYSDAKINPDLPDSALKLQLPKGVKREFPQK